jgi:hypothetical protein
MFDIRIKGCIRFSLKACIVCLGLLLLVLAGGCKKTPTPETAPSAGRAASEEKTSSSGKVYSPDIARCGGFTAEDAGSILGVPAAQLKVNAQELYAGTGTCSFEGGSPERTVAFTIAVAKSAEEAAGDMASYRSHLEVAGGTAPFKDKLPKGAYSDIMGLGDEGVWTDINKSLNIRKGNVSLLVTLPNDKKAQLKVAEKFLSKL